MSWEKHGRGRRFVYSIREGKNVRKVVVGGGEPALIASASNEIRKAEQRLTRQRIRAVSKAWIEADLSTHTAFVHASVLSRAQLASDRFQRPFPDQGFPNVNTKLSDLQKVLEKLTQRVKHGDLEAQFELQQMLQGNEAIAARTGDLARAAEERWIRLIAGDDLALKEAVRIKLNELKRRFSDHCDHPQLQLALESVSIAWLQKQHAEHRLAQPPHAFSGFAGFNEHRHSMAVNQYERALKFYAQMQRSLAA